MAKNTGHWGQNQVMAQSWTTNAERPEAAIDWPSLTAVTIQKYVPGLSRWSLGQSSVVPTMPLDEATSEISLCNSKR